MSMTKLLIIIIFDYQTEFEYFCRSNSGNKGEAGEAINKDGYHNGLSIQCVLDSLRNRLYT